MDTAPRIDSMKTLEIIFKVDKLYPRILNEN